MGFEILSGDQNHVGELWKLIKVGHRITRHATKLGQDWYRRYYAHIMRTKRVEQHAIYERGKMAQALRDYYGLDHLSQVGLFPLTTAVNNQSIASTHVARQEWMSLTVDLKTQPADNFKLNPNNFTPPVLPARLVNTLKARLQRNGVQLWDNPIYRLMDFSATGADFNVTFAEDTFLNYRHTAGLMMDELLEDLAHPSSRRPIQARLPLRRIVMGDAGQIQDTKNRVCAGGIAVVVALARKNEGDFLIPLHVRSSQVGESQGLLSTVPQAFHQPMTDPWGERAVLATVYREIFEELFGGEQLVGPADAASSRWDWYFDLSEPLSYLRNTHKQQVVIECLNFGYNLAGGQYDFGILMAVLDTSFWENYGEFVKNWESEGRIILLSSKHTGQFTELVTEKGWASWPLITVARAVERLRSLAANRVDLPNVRIDFA